MSHEITFDSPQDIELIARETVPAQASVHVTKWYEATEDILDEDGNKTGYNYDICVFIQGSRVPLKRLLYNDQTRLKEILDSADTAVNKKATVVKEAIQTGDYNS
jgi:hypothetical protein